MKRHLWSLMRVSVPVVGLMMCVLAYMLTVKTEHAHTAILVYVLVTLGFLAMLVGFFWNICHSMKSKLYQRGGCEQSIHVFTIQRPSFLPPSYEECQSGQVSSDRPSDLVGAADGVDMQMSLAPPLYSLSGSEDSDCRWSWEQPPRYSQVENIPLPAEGSLN